MSAPSPQDATILCLSHLAWENRLFQRPQQIMSRLGKRGFQILYVGCVGWKKCRQMARSGGIEGGEGNTKHLHVGYSPYGGLGEQFSLWVARQQISRRLNRMGCGALITWVYHPGLLALAESYPRKLLAYDIMDEFRAFNAHGGRSIPSEEKLLEEADLIFTGGRSLQKAALHKLSGSARPGRRPFCIPSGIDLDHFARASLPGGLPSDIASLPRPVFGYFGALDERIDYDLVIRLAEQFKEGSVVLVGPVLSPPGSPLPANVHLLGARDYRELPEYLRGFQVTLLPFRQSDLVAHISPTKTPEYLAGGKTVVSSLVPDVQTDYGDVVQVAATPEEFLEACRRALESPLPPERLIAAARRALTWEQIADEVSARLHEALNG